MVSFLLYKDGIRLHLIPWYTPNNPNSDDLHIIYAFQSIMRTQPKISSQRLSYDQSRLVLSFPSHGPVRVALLLSIFIAYATPALCSVVSNCILFWRALCRYQRGEFTLVLLHFGLPSYFAGWSDIAPGGTMHPDYRIQGNSHRLLAKRDKHQL